MNQDEVILTFLKEFKAETKEELLHLRKTNHNINNELNGVNGQLLLLRKTQDTQEKEMEEKFRRVHNRIDKEQEEVRGDVREVKKSLAIISETLQSVTPKVSSWDDTLKIAKKVVVTTVTVAILGLIGSKMTGII